MKNICDICGKEFEGDGNNPAPLDGKICCDKCNVTYVIPARLKKININKKLDDASIETSHIETPQITELRNRIGFLISEEVKAIDDYDDALKTVSLSEEQRKTLEEIRNDELDHTNKLNEIYKGLMTGAVEEYLTEDESNLEESFAGGYDPATINTELEIEPNVEESDVQDGLIETVSNAVEKIGNLSTATEDDEQDVQETLKENEISSSVTDAEMTVDRMIQIITPIVRDYAKKKGVEDYWKIHKNGKNVSVGMELGYRDMDKLCDILNAKLEPLTDSYFEPADAGLIETTVFDSAIRDETVTKTVNLGRYNRYDTLVMKKANDYGLKLRGERNVAEVTGRPENIKLLVDFLNNYHSAGARITDSDTVNDIGEITVGSKYRFEEKYGNQPLTVTELGETVKLSLDNSKTYLRIPREKFEDMIRTGRLDNTDTTTIEQYGAVKAGDRRIGDFKSEELVNIIRTKFNTLGKEKIQKYAEQLKTQGGYKDFGTRLVWDLVRITTKSSEMLDWYDKYDVNYDHITRAGKDALKRLGISL